jgi:hypothetical protein
MGNLAGLELGPIRNPDVSLTPQVEYPGNAWRSGRSRKTTRERRVHYLFERKTLGLRNHRQSEAKDKQQLLEDFHKRTIILAAGCTTKLLLSECYTNIFPNFAQAQKAEKRGKKRKDDPITLVLPQTPCFRLAPDGVNWYGDF